MEAGLEYDDCGTLAENSSRILVRREKAGRTGYSWSVIMMAAGDTYEVARYKAESGQQTDLQVALLHHGCIHGRYNCSPARSVAGPDLFFR